MASIWVRTDYFIDSSDHTQMIALGSKLFITGSASESELSRLLALDVHTGDMIWQYGDAKVNTLTSSTTRLFVGELGGGKVVALNPSNGAIIWSANLRQYGNVTKVFVRENKLYVDTVGTNHVILDAETGKLLQIIPYAVDNVPNPEIPNWSNANMNLQFTGNIMYFQKQSGYPDYKGEISAIDELSRDQVWNSGPLSAVTRIVTSPIGIFVLEIDGKLSRFEPSDGAKEQIIQFVPTLTLRNEEGWVYGYYVAVDSDNQLLFVYLGDSRQLFAFNIQ
ncbi:MAG TPA: PQQ-binding-like beta-propeller repeat protein [Anaerolineales bacterium]|nr:PQQ-binding-like beta-propeller repeat protein [Anaerolineales bacterium]